MRDASTRPSRSSIALLSPSQWALFLCVARARSGRFCGARPLKEARSWNTRGVQRCDASGGLWRDRFEGTHAQCPCFRRSAPLLTCDD